MSKAMTTSLSAVTLAVVLGTTGLYPAAQEQSKMSTMSSVVQVHSVNVSGGAF